LAANGLQYRWWPGVNCCLKKAFINVLFYHGSTQLFQKTRNSKVYLELRHHCRPTRLAPNRVKGKPKNWLSFPQLWFAIPLTLSALLCRANISLAERPLVSFWQLVGLLSALYSLLHYPLMPVVGEGRGPEFAYALVLSFWIISILSGFFCFRIPSLSLLAPSFLVWSNAVAGYITGLPTTTDLDIMPLAEVSLCIGLGLFINQASRPLLRRLIGESNVSTDSLNDAPHFAHLVLLIAIAVHLANYFWSFIAKMSLDGPWFAWLTQNNAAFLFLTALDDHHIIFER
jgi:hypothetical protein